MVSIHNIMIAFGITLTAGLATTWGDYWSFFRKRLIRVLWRLV